MNILIVCTGNTCRSPMAEGLLRSMLESRNAEGIQVGSAGIAALPGMMASNQAVKVMQEFGVDLESHRTRQVNKKLLQEADLILTMTEGHKNAIQSWEPSVWSKIHTLKEYAGMEEKDISDPYGLDDDAYRKAAREIREALEKIVDKLL
ncbi:MAG TPA: low molecular weight protein arginine phosphatase [Clostridiales bacterium]|nr:low molecular weight protein arginine phosphatase [Clostridiales bacterium]